MPRKESKQIALTVNPNVSVGQASYDYALRLVDPEGHDAALSPAPVTVRSTAVKSKKVLDLRDAYTTTSGPGTAFGVITASPSGTLTLTTRSTDPLSAVGITWSMQSSPAGPISKFNPVHMESSVARHDASTQVAITAPGSGGPGPVQRIGFNSNTETFDLKLEHTGNYDLGFSLWAGSLTGITPYKICDGHCGPSGVVIPAEKYPSNQYNVFWFDLCGPGVQWSASFVPSSGSTLTHNLLSSEPLVTVTNMDVLSDIPALEFYRVTALGVLITYQGSDISNGGRIACAKVSKWWTPDESDVLDSIAKLPNDCHEGALKNGAHMHWVPSSIDDLIPRHSDAESDDHLFRYVFAINADDVTQSTRLMLTMHIEYYSTSPSYGSMNYCPDAQGLSLMLAYVNSKIPVCTENDTHLTEKMLKHVKSGAKYGLKTVLAHPELLSSALAMLL